MQASITLFQLAGLFFSAVFLLGYAYLAYFTPQEAPAGWVRIGAGRFHWLGFFCAVIIAVACFCGWMFAPPEEFNARFSRDVFYWMGTAFAIAAAYQARFIVLLKKRNICWYGSTIQQTECKGDLQSYAMADFESAKSNPYSEFRISFLDGRMIKVDAYMKNFDALMIALHQARDTRMR